MKIKARQTYVFNMQGVSFRNVRYYSNHDDPVFTISRIPGVNNETAECSWEIKGKRKNQYFSFWIRKLRQPTRVVLQCLLKSQRPFASVKTFCLGRVIGEQ